MITISFVYNFYFSIWQEIIFIVSFNSLGMVAMNSFIIFNIADLKCMSSNSKIWEPLRTFSVVFVSTTGNVENVLISFYFSYFLLKTGHFRSYVVKILVSDTSLLLEFVVVSGLLLFFLLLLICLATFLDNFCRFCSLCSMQLLNSLLDF